MDSSQKILESIGGIHENVINSIKAIFLSDKKHLAPSLQQVNQLQSEDYNSEQISQPEDYSSQQTNLPEKELPKAETFSGRRGVTHGSKTVPSSVIK
jgi:hypothetical protein